MSPNLYFDKITSAYRENIEPLEQLEIELLLEALYRYYGFDFRDYVLPSIRRRIWHRIHAEKLSTISGLQEKVLHDRNTMKRLIADFSINVTEMFRDPSFFRAFRTTIVPLLQDYACIRIWHAGCSTGEEVYSMAILMHEEGLHHKTRYYATDMNADVIEEAKRRSFALDKLQAYSNNYMQAGGTKSLSDYYTIDNNQASLHPYLADSIVFAQHNLAVDQSFNEFHVIICRNVMIYFNSVLQNRVHTLFHESLSRSGFLGLGHKESIAYTSHSALYKEMDAHEKLYRKIK
ncbi:chemotaxis protein methyltransferase CheR [Paenibacillus cellulosilyticus]|uniref:Chemotaxis protein methyltransferase CheR n=1 Tax=Paenibacillus cellulosilyticus TaxID=375489 RepID=A0A2V2YGR0_9BACL|nr:CheR family methyltransferase [Paenibacillus cellulosilyticus]PWV92072.1 chemotaxis protein methyltransferase CheR [Paenibacillus cellulosilyticus]QKS44184.1 protein-glutamate O-methyltransferase CheR [Paenibacillus cellulosilyticus]